MSTECADSLKALSPPEIRFYDSKQPYYFLTNFFPSPIVYSGTHFATAEAFFQAAKFDFVPELQEEISGAEWPRRVLEKAQIHSQLVSPGWSERRLEIMRIAQILKYTQNPQLLQRLLQTCGAKLIEDSRIDSFWGIGNGNGCNHLGQILMEVRDQLRHSPLMNGIQRNPESRSRSLIWSSLHGQAQANSLSGARQIHVSPGLEVAPAAASVFLHGLSFEEGSRTIHGIVQTTGGLQPVPHVHSVTDQHTHHSTDCALLRKDGVDGATFYGFKITLHKNWLSAQHKRFSFVICLGCHVRTERFLITASSI
ncbi:unnamed protein product [Tilletia caries]|nr:hypothetical protein CF335_g4280 [Tilletia laevis]CAD6884509.1 unnamed protein product [Tilletia caries]CAD6975506.1 unnamed protein product [Tilletia controversa]